MPTIGVSLAVPEPWGSELRHHRLALGDTAAHQIPTHVTLLPPYETSDACVRELTTHLEGVAAATEPFTIHLRGTGTFRPVSPVVFLTLVEGISQCEQLAADVLSGPVRLERDFPFHPHVTVAHHLDEAGLDRAFEELAGYEAEFAVQGMWMYNHDPAVGWHPARSFTFTA